MSSTHIDIRADDAHAPATTPASTRPVAVAELKLAWSAVQSGEFRHARARKVEPPQLHGIGERCGTEVRGAGSVPDSQLPPPRPSTPDEARPVFAGQRWVPIPGERVLPVLGAAGSVGCSTVALALATAAANHGDPRWASRVVECCSAPVSGLAAASTAELGHHHSGWLQGSRGAVLLERASRVLLCAEDVPAPAPVIDDVAETDPEHDPGERLTVLDTGWEIGHLLAGDGWLAEFVRRAPMAVVVARPTIPGFRRLEAALEVLEAEHGIATQVAVLSGRRKRWAKGIERSAGPRTRAALRENRLHVIPEDRHLAVAGLDPTPLPPALVAAGEQLLTAALTTSLSPSPSLVGSCVAAPVPGCADDAKSSTSTNRIKPRIHVDNDNSFESGTTFSSITGGTAR